ncbi:MAG: ATP-grasp domain-containing protein [Mycobacterium leprae]
MILLIADYAGIEPTPRYLLERIQAMGGDACIVDTVALYSGAAHLALHWEKNGDLSGGLTVNGRQIPWQEVRAALIWRPWFGQFTGSGRGDMDKESLKFMLREWRKFYNGLTLMLSQAGPFCVNPAPVNTACEEKIWQLELARRTGFRIPDTLMTTNLADARSFFAEHGGEIIYKTFSMAAVKLDKGEPGEEKLGLIYTSRVKPEQLADHGNMAVTPMLFQALVPKQFEVRATYVEGQIFAASIDATASPTGSLDWRHYDQPNTRYAPIELPPEVAEKLITLHRTLGLHYGATDLIVTPEGEYVYLETNPNGMYLWVEQATGLPITQALAELLLAADEGRVRKDEYDAFRRR